MRFVHIKTPAGAVLFLVQYSALVYLIISGSLYPVEWYTWIPYIMGWGLGIWALIAMESHNLNAGADVMPGAQLVRSGPYHMIRHPMYAAILLIFIPLVLTSTSNIRIAVLSILSLNLILKIRYEEKRLRNSFAEYSEYSAGTWRLLPYVY